MSEFSITNAATEGFRVTRENPVAMAVWSVLQVVLQFAMVVALVKSGLQFQIQRMGVSGPPDISTLFGGFAELEKQMLWLLPLCWLIQIPFRAAILRAILRPEEASPSYLRLGGDELRLFGLQIVLGLITSLGLAVLMGVAVLLGRAGGMGAVLGAIVVIAGVCALIYILVRLSLAAPQTFATRKVNIFGSWALTEGRVGPLLGAYLLAFAFYILVVILGSVLAAVFSLIGGGDTGDARSLAGYFTVSNVAVIIVQGVIAALGVTLLLAPPAAVYKAMTSRPLADVF